MKKIHLATLLFLLATSFLGKAQTTTLAGDYKVINIGTGTYGDYTHALILLHEMYNGTLIGHNYAIGTITAIRGTAASYNRLNVVNISTASAYSSTSGALNSNDNYATWKFKTCIYNSKKYLAVDIPYGDAYHDWGYWFSGSTTSTGENMKCVPYLVGGSPVNQSILSNIQDYTPDMVESHDVAALNITGKVGIGTTSPDEKLTVYGKIHSQEVKVDLSVPGPDYVFEPTYKLPSLADIKIFVDKNRHLPEIPTAAEMAKNGIDLGDMTTKLLKKVEELTLYLIEKDKEVKDQNRLILSLEKRLEVLEQKK